MKLNPGPHIRNFLPQQIVSCCTVFTGEWKVPDKAYLDMFTLYVQYFNTRTIRDENAVKRCSAR